MPEPGEINDSEDFFAGTLRSGGGRPPPGATGSGREPGMCTSSSFMPSRGDTFRGPPVA